MSKTLNSKYVKEQYEDYTLSKHKKGYEYYRWRSSPSKRKEFSQMRSKISDALKDVKKGSFLEIGCGPGTWTELIIKKANSIDVLDISENMLKEVKRRFPKAKRILGDFEKAKLRKKYDAVFTFRAIEYMPNKKRVVRQLYSSLKKNGTLIIVTKNPHKVLRKILLLDLFKKKRRLHTEQISPRHLTDLLEKAGFRDILITPNIVSAEILGECAFTIWLSRIIWKMMRRHRLMILFSPLIESYFVVAKK